MKASYRAATIFVATCIVATSALAASGITPAQAIPIEPGIHEGSSAVTLFYSFVANSSGILDVALMPEKGEVDLAVTHQSGSPSAESRREGMTEDRVSIRVESGDRFLIRVASPLRVVSKFKLMVAMAGDLSAPVSAASDIFVPESAADGASRENAVELAIGKLVPVEALGTRHFKADVPAGLIAVVTAYPVFGDVSIEARMMEGGMTSEAASTRPGNLVEQIYLPTTAPGALYLKVTPMSAGGETDEMSRLRRYAIVVRLRHLGLTESQSETPDDLSALKYLFPRESLGTGVPSGLIEPASAEKSDARMILRLK